MLLISGFYTSDINASKLLRRKLELLKVIMYMYNYVPEQEIIAYGYPAYTTSAGWLGYTDTQLRELCQKYLKAGWTRLVCTYLTMLPLVSKRTSSETQGQLVGTLGRRDFHGRKFTTRAGEPLGTCSSISSSIAVVAWPVQREHF